MSGHTADVVLGKGIENQEVDFIAKPLSPVEFKLKVGEILAQRQLSIPHWIGLPPIGMIR